MDEISALALALHHQPVLMSLAELLGIERFYEWLAERYPHLPTQALQLQRLRIDHAQYVKKQTFENQLKNALLQECVHLHEQLQTLQQQVWQFFALYLLLYDRDICLLFFNQAYLQRESLQSLLNLRKTLFQYLNTLQESKHFVRGILMRLNHLEKQLTNKVSQQQTVLQEHQQQIAELQSHKEKLLSLVSYYDQQRSLYEMELALINQQVVLPQQNSTFDIQNRLQEALTSQHHTLQVLEKQFPVDEEILQDIMDDLDRLAEGANDAGSNVLPFSVAPLKLKLTI